MEEFSIQKMNFKVEFFSSVGANDVECGDPIIMACEAPFHGGLNLNFSKTPRLSSFPRQGQMKRNVEIQ